MSAEERNQQAPHGLVRLSDEEEGNNFRQFDAHLLRRLLVYLKPYRRQVAQMIMMALVTIGATLTLPYLLKVGIDRYIVRHDLDGLGKLVLISLGIAGLQYGSMLGQGRMMIKVGQSAICDLRQALFTHIQGLDMGFFDRQKAGRIMLRVTNDVNSLEELLSSGVSTAFVDSFTLVGLLVVMFVVDWRLSLVMLLTLPVMVWVAVYLRNRLFQASRNIRYRLSIVNANLNESLMGIRVTQAFSRETVNAELFRKINQAHYQATRQFVPINAFFWPWSGFLNTVGTAAVLLLGGLLTVSGWATLGSVAAFLNYVNRFFQPIQNLSNLVNVIGAAMASCERIFELMDLQPAVVEPTESQPLIKVQGRVSFREVDFSYDRNELVLDKFNLEVQPGETIAIVGPTGAGKSTILNLLCRFYDPVAGQVLLDGRDLRTIAHDEYSKHLAIVLQDTFIFSGTIAENISYGKPEASQAEIETVARNLGIHEFIMALPQQYATPVRERGGGLSVGQRQLIAFARALIRKPQILILDEATSNIDTQTEQQLQAALQQLLAGRTAFIIAHRLSTIRNADRIIVIDRGKIAEMGNHETLLQQNGVYAKLSEAQNQVG